MDISDLSKIFGESKEEQKLRLKERLARRQQLKVEREAAGLDTDDKILDALMLQEEQKLTTRPKVIKKSRAESGTVLKLHHL